jgi:hypothetical protein
VLGWDLGEGDLLRCDVDGGGVSHTGRQGREGNGDELCVCVFFVAVNFFFVPLRTFLCLGLGALHCVVGAWRSGGENFHKEMKAKCLYSVEFVSFFPEIISTSTQKMKCIYGKLTMSVSLDSS